ncbi:hypothetical protein Ddye_029620 [Dipteronia dyeriana]|uniref:Uncharacterized protein n=1 Tax=Dipteronia dyeriana TaxID=168575 RepID=A0AAD9TFG7_9ROSI|nr:hypothetical protein Ddye_029620 [Dipteronia dyeriana]
MQIYLLPFGYVKFLNENCIDFPESLFCLSILVLSHLQLVSPLMTNTRDKSSSKEALWTFANSETCSKVLKCRRLFKCLIFLLLFDVMKITMQMLAIINNQMSLMTFFTLVVVESQAWCIEAYLFMR